MCVRKQYDREEAGDWSLERIRKEDRFIYTRREKTTTGSHKIEILSRKRKLPQPRLKNKTALRFESGSAELPRGGATGESSARKLCVGMGILEGG